LEPAKSSVAKQQRRQISVIMAFEPQEPFRAMPCVSFQIVLARDQLYDLAGRSR
jgi:hypothetical protein